MSRSRFISRLYHRTRTVGAAFAHLARRRRFLLMPMLLVLLLAAVLLVVTGGMSYVAPFIYSIF